MIYAPSTPDARTNRWLVKGREVITELLQRRRVLFSEAWPSYGSDDEDRQEWLKKGVKHTERIYRLLEDLRRIEEKSPPLGAAALLGPATTTERSVVLLLVFSRLSESVRMEASSVAEVADIVTGFDIVECLRVRDLFAEDGGLRPHIWIDDDDYRVVDLIKPSLTEAAFSLSVRGPRKGQS